MAWYLSVSAHSHKTVVLIPMFYLFIYFLLFYDVMVYSDDRETII